jgi:hypothetical protein
MVLGRQKMPQLLSWEEAGDLREFFSTIGYHFQTWLKSVTDYSFPGAPLLAVIFIGVGITALWRGKKPRQVFFKQWLFIPVITYVFLYLRYESHPHSVI